MKIKVKDSKGSCGGIVIENADTGETIQGVKRLAIEADHNGCKAHLEFVDVKHDFTAEVVSKELELHREIAKVAMKIAGTSTICRGLCVNEREKELCRRLEEALHNAGYEYEEWC